MKANEIFVLSKEKAIEFRPKRETYIIRVFGKDNLPFDLDCKEDKRVVYVDEFYFDSFDNMRGNKKIDFLAALRVPESERKVIFARRDANRLLGNFVQYFRDGMDLMVHCREGKNRSAGIACALNDVFELYSSDFMKQHQEYDRHVYWKILRASLFNGIVAEERRDVIRDLISKSTSEEFSLLSFFK